MSFSPDWNELDQCLWRVQKDKSAILPFFRSLLSAELDVLMSYQNELEGFFINTNSRASFEARLSQFILSFGLVVHAAHAATHAWRHRRSFFLFRHLRDDGFGG
jgi:hypothetical protein